MMNDASIRPRSRNTFACSAGMSSGWRAPASRKREHMMPMPIHAPAAPRPIMRPIPILVYAWIMARSCIFSILFPFVTFVRVGFENASVAFVGHRQVDDREHHENERLQRDDQDVEDRPAQAERRAEDRAVEAGRGPQPQQQ